MIHMDIIQINPFKVLNNRIFFPTETSFHLDKQHGFIRSAENIILNNIYT